MSYNLLSIYEIVPSYIPKLSEFLQKQPLRWDRNCLLSVSIIPSLLDRQMRMNGIELDRIPLATLPVDLQELIRTAPGVPVLIENTVKAIENRHIIVLGSDTIYTC